MEILRINKTSTDSILYVGIDLKRLGIDSESLQIDIKSIGDLSTSALSKIERLYSELSRIGVFGQINQKTMENEVILNNNTRIIFRQI